MFKLKKFIRANDIANLSCHFCKLNVVFFCQSYNSKVEKFKPFMLNNRTISGEIIFYLKLYLNIIDTFLVFQYFVCNKVLLYWTRRTYCLMLLFFCRVLGRMVRTVGRTGGRYSTDGGGVQLRKPDLW